MKFFRSDSLKTHALWNFLAFALLGFGGLFLIVLIARFYTPETLGVFNLVYSIFIIMSQLVGAGIHFSVLRYVSSSNEEQSTGSVILRSAITVSFANAVAFIVLFMLLKSMLVTHFEMADIDLALNFIVPGLLFCGANKVLLSYINAHERFIAYASMNIIRSITLIVTVVMFVLAETPGYLLPLILSVAEIIMFAAAALYLRRPLFGVHQGALLHWCKLHLSFGYRSVIGSVFVDINTRVDVLVLGFFSSAAAIGVYSYAAMIVDGFSQLAVVFRTILNPKLSRANNAKDNSELQELVRKWRNYSYAIFVPAGVVLILCFVPAIKVLQLDEVFLDGLGPFCVLMAGLLCSIGYAPLLMIFGQRGFPGLQSFLYFSVFLTNLVLNLILVPFLGVMGSALGTAISYISFVLIVRHLMKRFLGLSA